MKKLLLAALLAFLPVTSYAQNNPAPLYEWRIKVTITNSEPLYYKDHYPNFATCQTTMGSDEFKEAVVTLRLWLEDNKKGAISTVDCVRFTVDGVPA